jgi:hypothetical protein
MRDHRAELDHCERSEAIQSLALASGLLRRFAPRNDEGVGPPGFQLIDSIFSAKVRSIEDDEP